MQSKCEVVVRAVPGVAVLELHGEVDGSAADVLSDAYDRAVSADQAPRVLLDFAAVDYINSTGIALIVSILGKARADRRTVAASGLSDHYRQIFTITRLSDFIEMYADADTAVASTSATAG